MNPRIGRDDSMKYPIAVAESRLPSTDFREIPISYEDATDLRDFLDIVLRRKWLICAIVACVVVPTWVYNLAMKPIYKATGTIELSPDIKVTKFENITPGLVSKRGDFGTQIELLQSNALADRVIEKLQLEQHPLFDRKLQSQKENVLLRYAKSVLKFKDSLISSLSGWLQGAEEQEARVADPAISKLRRLNSLEGFLASDLSIEPKEDTEIISISFDSIDPKLASDVVNTLIDQFVNWQMDRRVEAAKSAKQQLEKQLSVARSQLETSEKDMNDFAKKAGIVSLDSKLNLVYQELEKINTALAESETQRIQKMEVYGYVKNADLSSISNVLQNPLILQLKQEYIMLMAEYQKLSVDYKDDYPTVKNLKAKIADIKRMIDTEQQRILNSLKNDYLTAANIEEKLRNTAGEKKAVALKLSDQVSRYKIFEREVEINKQIYQSLLERSKEIDANVGTDLSSIKTVDLAALPLSPYKPKMLRNVLLALVIGLMGGTGLALLTEHLDSTVKRVDDISDRYSIPVFGVIPLVKKSEADDLFSMVRVSPLSIFSEAIRFAQTSIDLGNSRGGPVKSFLVTSTAPGEGKTTISVSLAQSFATLEEKVLLMDVDLRRPRLSGSLNGNSQAKGLSHYLRGMATLEEIFQKTETPNLVFIGSGPISPNPQGLLLSSKMNKLMENLVQHFDRIILDAPPFGLFGDVLYLGHKVDGIILISTLGQTHGEALRTFRKHFLVGSGQFVGAIINKFNIDKGQYYGDYYRSHYRNYHATYGQGSDNFPVDV
jgi:polysaccharide biosynthesis transport protein